MDKKEYQVPSMEVVKIQTATILAGSEVNSVSGGDFGYGGGGSGPARARQRGGWDDEE